jgi:signal peptidase complex subunit 2
VSSRTSPSDKTKAPGYEVSLNYIRSTSNGKSLLGKGKTHASRPYTEFFDESGVLQQEKLEQFVGELVEEAMEGKAL